MYYTIKNIKDIPDIKQAIKRNDLVIRLTGFIDPQNPKPVTSTFDWNHLVENIGYIGDVDKGAVVVQDITLFINSKVYPLFPVSGVYGVDKEHIFLPDVMQEIFNRLSD